MQMVSQTRISPRQQRQWFAATRERRDQQHWVLWCKGVRAGYVNLKGECQDALQGQAVADAGLYLGNSTVRHPMLAVAAALSQLDQGFDELHIGCIRTLVRENNRSALRLNEQLGYSQIRQENGFFALELLPALLANLEWREDRLRAAIDSGMYATDAAVEAAIAGVPFREAYKAAAASAGSAGQGRTPEGSLAARTSPGAAADLRLDALRQRWQALA